MVAVRVICGFFLKRHTVCTKIHTPLRMHKLVFVKEECVDRVRTPDRDRPS